MEDGIRIPRFLSFRYSNSAVEVVGNYNSKNWEVIDLNEASFREYKPWQGEEINLLEGYDDYEDKFLGQEGHISLNELLKWIIGTNYRLSDKEINFVTKRGVLRTIAATAHRRKSKWEYKICRYNGIIYISNDKKNKKLERGYGLKCSYAGTVFQGSRVTREDGVFPYLVAECRFKGIKCLIAGEPDCQDQDDFIEIKTTTVVDFERNSYKGWLQAYLLGNQRVLYGLRNNNFILEDVKDEKVADIPGKYEILGNWKGCDMLGFLYSVLQKIQEKVPEGSTCTIKYDGRQMYHITVENENEVFLINEFKEYVSRQF